MKRIITHSGGFHCDDIFAVATLELLLDQSATQYIIVRTREQSDFETGDFVVDVGGIYDPHMNRFDHHQEGGAGVRPNGIPYASFGLVWKEFGTRLCGSEAIAEKIDRRLVAPVDGIDSGVLVYEPKFKGVYEYSIAYYFDAFSPTWKEPDVAPSDVFLTMVARAKELLAREIKRNQDKAEADAKVRELYEVSPDKRIIEFVTHYPWKETLTEFPEPLFIISPREDHKYQVYAVPKGDPREMKYRKYLPREWAGLRDADLARVSGVPDALFCHNDCFIAVAGSLEGARALAQKALI
jgi:uncharacterized UPF0160 family protein